MTPAEVRKRFLRGFQHRQADYARLVERVGSLLHDLVRGESIDVVSVSGRVKTLESVREKLARKRYAHPDSEMTDLCGVRIVAYLESDLDALDQLVRREFEVDEMNSVDKRQSLQPDQLGYRSIHLICRLSEARSHLPEYRDITDIQFELQIRTVLQHAWAQIEWGRNYKFGGVLPEALQRRLLLASGTLEMIDREFAAIANEVDKYSAQTATRADAPVNSLVIRSVAQRVGADSGAMWHSAEPSVHDSDQLKLMEELRGFGIATRGDLVGLFADDLLAAWSAVGRGRQNELGMCRDAMMWADLAGYFDKAHRGNWHSMDAEDIAILLRQYSAEEVTRVLAENEMDVEEESLSREELETVIARIAEQSR